MVKQLLVYYLIMKFEGEATMLWAQSLVWYNIVSLFVFHFDEPYDGY